ncbi:MAG TPA: hypothetical protein PLP88_12815 [Bacteroidales bacterium]|nr:hypothetical protein [Bacteroidales bacterium]
MKKRINLILGIIQIFVAAGALPAGYAMMADPSGEGLGMTTEMLTHSPFGSFLIPGIFLFTVNGLLQLIAGILTLKRRNYMWLPGIGLGIALLIWIIVQVLSIGLNSVLQPVYFGIGLIEIALSLLYRKVVNRSA